MDFCYYIKFNMNNMKETAFTIDSSTIKFGNGVTEEVGWEFKKLNCNKGYVNVVICHTVMSKGIKMFENDPTYHWKGGIDNELHNKMIESIEEYK